MIDVFLDEQGVYDSEILLVYPPPLPPTQNAINDEDGLCGPGTRQPSGGSRGWSASGACSCVVWRGREEALGGGGEGGGTSRARARGRADQRVRGGSSCYDVGRVGVGEGHACWIRARVSNRRSVLFPRTSAGRPESWKGSLSAGEE